MQWTFIAFTPPSLSPHVSCLCLYCHNLMKAMYKQLILKKDGSRSTIISVLHYTEILYLHTAHSTVKTPCSVSFQATVHWTRWQTGWVQLLLKKPANFYFHWLQNTKQLLAQKIRSDHPSTCLFYGFPDSTKYTFNILCGVSALQSHFLFHKIKPKVAKWIDRGHDMQQ